ncbi:hypothetical protein AMELA_G00125520 [Ameiurus melas]|uniref:A kinase-anchoring proteins AKAP-5 and AKAP-12 calmodulin (CaM)-binding domain-containing protein n=1 Tax=Ameiurus melas TaxID=219545 RepID=A0A7J6AQ18_AMEME|nr:hypothetical protein AMELA_G00125520 [Ameiurus melas]
MGATLSAPSICEEDEEQPSGQDELPEDSGKDKKNGQISSQNGKTETQTDEMNSQSEDRDLVDVGSGFVTLKEDVSDATESIQDVSQTSTDSISKQMNNTDDIIAKEANEANNKLNDTEIGFKKIFRFAGFKFTVKKDKVEKIDAEEQIENEQDRKAVGPTEDSWDTTDVNTVSTNKQYAEEIRNKRMGGYASAESPETHNEMAVGKISEFTEHREEATPDSQGLMEDVPQSPEPEEPMSPIKRFFSLGILSSFRKKRKEDENEEELKSLDKMVEKENTTCTCIDVSNGTFDEDKDIQLFKKDEHRPEAEGDIMNSLEQDKVQASPFKRLFRKLSLRRQSETKPGDTNLLEPGENINENSKLSTELIKSQKEQEIKVVETQPADEMLDTSHEESKKKSDSTVSWENLICIRSAKTRARKTANSEDETQDKAEMPRRTTESPLESSTDGDHLTSSNEQGGSPAEEDSGSTWKSFKKLVTPKRKGRMEESGSIEQMQSDTELTKDESSCSLRKLISGRKKIKPDGPQENISSDEGSKGTGTDIEDEDTPGVVPLSEYEIVEPEILNVMTDGTIDSKKEKEIQPIIEEDKPKQIQPLNNIKPLCFDAGPSGISIPTEYMEELTEFLSKHQQLSDIPEEGIIEESVATPISFVEWTTQDETLDDDMTADAVTAPEHASEHNGDESTEMVSAVSQLSESPKTSGNVTPISPVYNRRESDTIFQQVVESFSMVPNVLSITTNDKVPEALAVSVSQFMVESATTTETKVLVTHKKEEATSICIGIVSREIRAAEVVLPLPLVEGISEIAHAVPTEFVSEDLAEEPEAAGIATDNVYEAAIKEIKTMLHEVLLLDEQSTVLAETARKSKQQFIMVENIEEEVPVVQMEDVDDDSTELLNGINVFTPVHTAVCGGTELLEDQIITLKMNRPEIEGPLKPVLDEPVYKQLTQNTQISVEVEKECRIPDVESSAVNVEQPALVAVAGPVEHNAIESVSDSSLHEGSKIIEDVVQVIAVAQSVTHSAVTSEPDPAMNQASETIEDMSGVLVSDEKCSENTKIEMDLENEIQIKNDPSLNFVDINAIQIKVNNTEKNVMTVLALGTTFDAADIFENIEMIGEEEKAKQKIEPASAEKIEEIVHEKIVYNFEAENLSEIIDKHTKEREGTESEFNTFVRESALPIATTNDENANKEPKGLSKAMLGLEKEHTETETILVEDCKRKQTADDEMYTLALNPPETVEETMKPLAISEQPRVYEKMAEDGILPPTTDNSKAVLQPTFSKLSAGTQTTAIAPGSREEDSAKTEAIKSPCVGDKSDKHLANEQEQNETAKPEANPEITTEQETVETVKPFSEVEPRLDPDKPQTEVLPSKPEQSQATESSHEENNQATEAMDKMTETISTVTCIHEEDTGVECNISEQPVATPQCFNGIDRVSSLEEVKRPYVDVQYVMSDTPLAEKQEDNETAKPVNTETIAEPQEAVETVKTFPKVESRLNTEQKEILSLKPDNQSSDEPYEVNNQVTGTAEIPETISSVIYEEDTGVECKISDQPEDTEQCFKGIDGVPVSIMAHVTEILPKDKAKSPEGFAISETEGSEHLIEVMKANTYQVSIQVVSEHESEMTVGSEQYIVTPDMTEQDKVSEMNTDLTAAMKPKEEKTMIISEGQTEVTSELVAESPIVIENKTEPEVLTQVIIELKAETREVTESQADIIVVSEVQAETPVVSSLITELEVETQVVTSTETSVNIEALALTSEINTFQSDLKSVDELEFSAGTTLQEPPIVVSGIQTATGLYLVQTAALSSIIKKVSEKEDANVNRPVIVDVTDPKLELFMVTEAISHTSAVPVQEVQTVETSALETEDSERACVEKNVEAQGSVVPSVKEDTDVGSYILTTTVSEAQQKTVIPVVQTLVELTATDVPAIQKPIDGQLIEESEISMVAQEIKETKPDMSDAVEVHAFKICVAKETRTDAPEVPEQIIKGAVLTSVESESKATSVKEDIGSLIFTLIAEEPTASVAPVVQTPTMVPTEVQRPTFVTLVEALAVSAVKEVEMPFSGLDVQERHCDAQVNIEVKQPPVTEIEVKVTETIEQVTQDVENTTNLKEDSKSHEERSGRLKETSVPIVKIVESLPGADDDVWEDAVDDISDVQCSSTKASGDLQDATLCHGDK